MPRQAETVRCRYDGQKVWEDFACQIEYSFCGIKPMALANKVFRAAQTYPSTDGLDAALRPVEGAVCYGCIVST